MFIFVHSVHSRHQGSYGGPIFVLGPSFHLYLSCENVFTPQNTCIHAQNYCPQTVPICIQKSGFIGPLLYTSYISRSKGPRRPKLLRATSNINTNRFQVVLDHFGHFLENVHFRSFCSFRAPGAKWAANFGQIR